jgi:hypothetical protein
LILAVLLPVSLVFAQPERDKAQNESMKNRLSDKRLLRSRIRRERLIFCSSDL